MNGQQDKHLIMVVQILMFIMLATACSSPTVEFTPTHSPPPLTETPTAVEIATDTALPSPTSSPTLTPTATLTPSITPTPTTTVFVSENTPIVVDLPIITTENAYQVSALAGWTVMGMTDIGWTADASSLAVATTERIDLFDIYTREKWRSLFPQTEGVRQITFSPTGAWLVSSSVAGTEQTGYETTLEQWWGLDMKPQGKFGEISRGLSDMEFSASGMTLFTAFSTPLEEESSVEFWNVPTWTISNTLRAGSVLDLSVSNFGQRMITTPDRYDITMWDLEATGMPLFTIPTSFTGAIAQGQFSPDGALFASAHYDGKINIWNSIDGSLVRTLVVDTVVHSLAFNPGGTLLASGSGFEDNHVRLWRIDTGELLRTLEGHTASVDSLLFSPFGEMLVSGSYNGQIILWGIRP